MLRQVCSKEIIFIVLCISLQLFIPIKVLFHSTVKVVTHAFFVIDIVIKVYNIPPQKENINTLLTQMGKRNHGC